MQQPGSPAAQDGAAQLADAVVESKMKTIIGLHRESPPKMVEQNSISKVPDQFRRGNEEFFHPTTISIGLLHAGDKKLAMASKDFKITMLLNFMNHFNITEDDLVKTLSPHTRTLARFYIGSPYDLEKDPRNEVALEALILDSCCIVGLVTMYDWKYAWRAQSASKVVLNKDIEVLMFAFRQDFLKFENQIPYVVLVDVAKLALKPSEPELEFGRQLAKKILAFFQLSAPKMSQYLESGLSGVPHLLRLVLLYLFSANPNNNRKSPSSATKGKEEEEEKVDILALLSNSRSATELVRHGIKLKPKHTQNIGDIEFENGVLYMPRLNIDRNTPSLLWNLLVYELCRESNDTCFMSYIVFMDSLICSREDVEVLMNANILVIRFNVTDSIVSLFGRLADCFSPISFYFKDLVLRLNDYCDASLRPQRAEIVKKYHGERWSMINSILLFIFTITQTMFSILSHSKKEGGTGSKKHEQ